MPRIARIIAPGYPHHITQRGNNRTQVFFDDEDRLTYVSLLANYSKKYSLQIWAWCLMDNISICWLFRDMKAHWRAESV
jgi:putative transposase